MIHINIIFIYFEDESAVYTALAGSLCVRMRVAQRYFVKFGWTVLPPAATLASSTGTVRNYSTPIFFVYH